MTTVLEEVEPVEPVFFTMYHVIIFSRLLLTTYNVCLESQIYFLFFLFVFFITIISMVSCGGCMVSCIRLVYRV